MYKLNVFYTLITSINFINFNNKKKHVQTKIAIFVCYIKFAYRSNYLCDNLIDLSEIPNLKNK